MRGTPQEAPVAIQGCLEACRRCEAAAVAVVEQDASAYGVVGPHLRHCVEHFELLLDGFRSGQVDYDARPRRRQLERDPAAMLEALRTVATGLSGITASDLARPLTVLQTAAAGKPAVSTPSTLERELVFVSGHAVHHVAIMAFAARERGVTIPADLAVAFSTEAHRDSLAANR